MSEDKKAAKSEYQRDLLETATLLTAEITGDGNPDVVDIVYQTLREVALESWKNGLQAGAKRALQRKAVQETSGQPTQ